METTAGAPAVTASRWRTIGLGIVVLAGPSLIGIVPLAIVPALPALTAHFAQSGGGVLTGQFLLTLPALMIMIGAPAAGVLVRRFGLRHTVLTLLLLYALSGAAGLVVPGLAGMVVSRLLLGLAGGALAATSTALAGAYFHGSAREHLLGYMAAAPGLFAVVTLAASGWLVDHGGWRAPFGLYLAALPVLLLAFSVVDGRRPQSIEDAVKGDDGVSALWPIYAVLVILSIGMFMVSIHGSFLLGGLGVASATASGILLALPLVAVVVIGTSYGHLRKRLGAKAMVVACAALLGIGNMLVGAMPTLWGFALGAVFFGLGCGLVYPSLSSIILRRVPLSTQPRAAGLMTTGIFLGQFVNPLAVAPLRALTSVGGSFVLIGAAMIAVALIVAIAPLRTGPAD